MKDVVKVKIGPRWNFGGRFDQPMRVLKQFVERADKELNRLKDKTDYDWFTTFNIYEIVDGSGFQFQAFVVRDRTEEEIQRIEDKKKELKEAQKRVNQLKSELAHYEE